MKTSIKFLIAATMIIGTASAIAAPTAPKSTAPGFSDGGPAPMCWPSDPNCVPPIPPAAK